jgi:hypothetical protein
VEATGWPAHIKTDEQKKGFVEEYRLRGITINPANMVFNPGKREVAKLCLNSYK